MSRLLAPDPQQQQQQQQQPLFSNLRAFLQSNIKKC